MINLTNWPEYASHYEFCVALKFGDDLQLWRCYRNGYEAAKEAEAIGGIVVHNVRIQGYQE